MSRLTHTAFVTSFKPSTLHFRRQSRQTCPTLALASSNSQTPSTTPPRPKQPLRQLVLALIAATATTFLPTRTRPASAAHHHNTDTTIARAAPKSSTLNTTSPSTSSSSYDPHAAGTPYLIAGTSAFLASSVAVAVTHPIDTIKTMRQARASGTGKTTSEISLQSLYRGVSSNILKEAPNAAIYLGMYEVFKSLLLKLSFFSAVPLVAMCVAGMLGDGVGSIVRVPAEIVNKRLQLGLSNNWNEAVKDAFLCESGVSSTLASWFAVLWRDVPYGGLQIAGYEFVRLVLAGWGMSGMGYSVVAGAIAGVFAAVITTPADVLVTRMSTQSPQCYLETRQYMSASATFRRIVEDEGFGALWTGAVARGLFYMPMIGLFFMVYETFKHLMVNGFSSGARWLLLTSAGFGVLVRAFRTPLQLAVFAVVSGLFSRRKRDGGMSSVKW